MIVVFVFFLNSLLGAIAHIYLIGGSGPHEGNVAIYDHRHREWKYICDDQWDMRDAKVVCRQLKFAKAVRATRYSYFPMLDSTEGFDFNSTYWSSSIQCTGDERAVEVCNNGHIFVDRCHRGNKAGVVCTNVAVKVQRKPIPSIESGKSGVDTKVRLIGKSNHGFISSGYLEVLHDGVWGAVCSDGWSFSESFVACGNLGYPDIDENQPPPLERYQGSHYWMKNVHCAGTESTLYECKHHGWKRQICEREPVYLNCKRSPFLLDNRFDISLISNHDLRIRSGYRHSEGRVEIFHNNEWGSICHDNWSIREANVFCRQIGFGTAFEASHNASFGQGSGKIWLDELECHGLEKTIRECKHAAWGVNDCGHKEDAGVKCHYPYGETVEKIKLYGSANPLKGQIQVMHQGKWMGICGIGFGLREAAVICRQLGLGYPRRAMSTTTFGMVREKAMFNVVCSGDELSITHCSYEGPETGRCRFYDIAAVECTPNAPDLVMDLEALKKSIHIESKTLRSLSCAFEENCLGWDARWQMWYPDSYNRTLLRFTSRFWNRGTAHFRPNIRKAFWEWHACHQHFHSMERFSDYDLTDHRGMKVGEGHKASFCLEDYECEKGVKQIYQCENKGDQGVRVNCADTYKSDLDCQWIDISKVEPGPYRLRVVLNPKNAIYETDYSNNIASCQIEIKRHMKVSVESCQIETCAQMSHGGKGGGACCRFPFIYKGRQYRSCTTYGKNGLLWCATTNDYDKDGLWGICG